MTIGIDIRVLASPRRSGVEEYTEQLLGHMLPLDPSVQYKLFYSSYGRELKNYDWLGLGNVQLKKFRIPNRLLFYSALLANTPKIDRLLGGVDVFFAPHFFLAPLSVSCRRVTTFHDLSFERFPEFFSWRKRFWHRFEMRPSWQARFSDALIAVSDSTKYDLAQLYRIDPARINRVYSGISPSMYRPAVQELATFKKAFRLPDRYILFLGTREPRKNISGLIKAFELLKERKEFDDLHLVIAGSNGWLYGDIIQAQSRSPHRSHIRLAEYLDDRDRPFYYSLASAFVYPSFFEGFGFPPLEAMRCGTPVVTSLNSSLAEVAGDAALLVDPYNISEIAFAIGAVLTDDRLRSTLIEKGSRQAARFDWRACAQQTLEVLKGA